MKIQITLNSIIIFMGSFEMLQYILTTAPDLLEFKNYYELEGKIDLKDNYCRIDMWGKTK